MHQDHQDENVHCEYAQHELFTEHSCEPHLRSERSHIMEQYGAETPLSRLSCIGIATYLFGGC